MEFLPPLSREAESLVRKGLLTRDEAEQQRRIAESVERRRIRRRLRLKYLNEHGYCNRKFWLPPLEEPREKPPGTSSTSTDGPPGGGTSTSGHNFSNHLETANSRNVTLRRSARNPVTYREQNVPFRGTAAYASITALQEYEQTRLDDIEGVFWVILDLMLGGLSWRKLPRTSRVVERDAIFADVEELRGRKKPTENK